MKIVKVISLSVLSMLSIFLFLILFISFTSPYPVSHLLKFTFTLYPYEVNQIENMDSIDIDTYVYKDQLSYDIMFDQSVQTQDKTIVWVHGGGFVGGYKEDVKAYLLYLVSEGYTVVNLDYSLAPQTTYPTQIKEIGLVIEDLKLRTHQHVSLENLIFGGDSAGAHIALNFVTKEVNDDYQSLTQMTRTLSKNQIKGVILFCGPYDFIDLAKQETLLSKFLIHKIGWAYSGKYTWYNDASLLSLATLNFHTSRDFPPVFMTDANALGMFDFKAGAIKLMKAFENNQVGVYGILDYVKEADASSNVQTYEEAFSLDPQHQLVLEHNFQFRLEKYYDRQGNYLDTDESIGFSPGHIVLQSLLNYLEDL